MIETPRGQRSLGYTTSGLGEEEGTVVVFQDLTEVHEIETSAGDTTSSIAATLGTTIDNDSALVSATDVGGNIEITVGLVRRSGGLSGAVYISLMGGNDEDEGEPTPAKSWWGNVLEADPSLRIRGRFATLVRGLPLTGPNLNRAVAAAEADLAWLVTSGVATFTSPSTSRTSTAAARLSATA